MAREKYGILQCLYMIEQKGMTFNHDFGYSFPLSLPSKKREEEKENE